MKSQTMNESYFHNPIKLLHHLKDAGFTEKQAEAQVEIMSDYVEHEFATKKDLKNLELATKRDFKEFELATKRDFKEFELATKRDFKEFELATKRDFKELDLKFDAMFKDFELRLTVKTAAIVGSIVGFFTILDKFIK
jgi:adenine-specific DNA methylase